MRLRRKMVAADGPGWAVTDWDDEPLPGRWATEEDATRRGADGRVPAQRQRRRGDQAVTYTEADMQAAFLAGVECGYQNPETTVMATRVARFQRFMADRTDEHQCPRSQPHGPHNPAGRHCVGNERPRP